MNLPPALAEALESYGAEAAVGLLFAAAAAAFGVWKARRAWRRREFLDRINFSLTFLDDGVLKIRTLAEEDLSRIFLNRSAVGALLKAAGKTTTHDPTLPLPREDYWIYLNAVLNELSERFAAGLFKKLAGRETETRAYVVALTCEAAGETRTRKIRAIVVPADLMAALAADEPPPEPRLEKGHHKRRWITLRQLGEMRAGRPERFIEVAITA